MKSIARIISLLLLLGLVNACASQQSDGIKTPWDKWYFAFTTPKALPAQVTLLKLLDVDGYALTYWTIDQPQGSSADKRSEDNSVGNTQFKVVAEQGSADVQVGLDDMYYSGEDNS